LVAGACTPTTAEVDGVPAEDNKEFVAPERVRPPKVKPNLNVGRVSKCIKTERVDIESLTGQYFGPTDFAADQVRQTRELEFSTPSDIDIVDPREFSALIREGGNRDRTEDAVNLWLQWQLGVRPLGSDGSSTPPGNQKELIDGFYEHDSGRVVVRQEGELDSEYVILAHELAHAAVDQIFGIPDKKTLRLVDDETLATTAAVEGDATLVELRFSSRFGGEKGLKRYVKTLVSGRKLSKGDEGLPHAVLERFTFPYRWGLAFVCSVFDKGGWAAVDRVHRRLPKNSAEILFPDRYLKKQRSKQPAPIGEPGGRWKLYAQGAIGAADLKALFEAPADSKHLALSRPLARAAAWNGGRFKLWATGLRETASALGISLVEHRDHPGLLCSSMLDWYREAFHYAKEELVADRTVAFSDPTRTTLMSCQGTKVKIAMAPERPLAEAIAGL
jgi:hypothetical protein